MLHIVPNQHLIVLKLRIIYLMRFPLVFFLDVTSDSPLAELICLRRKSFHSLLTVPRATETKAAPLAKSPRLKCHLAIAF